ncbi:dTDP-4-amino-4,6-dideoxy-D-galactose acyltransferase [Vibrio splendidus]|uniref:dTDP-4-amino-4,6-dideoxy-D-galactose acyltransferase n=1 Tax=Vibrio splendidus TaxID=29497 RepID=A0A7Y4D5S4_VIBSP|nr:dTDP-4-amino-4,6-dideoxy-D-galactose acyltransferase [Vibrio splendidus]NOJ13124.1 dTDP-4-amino-4,6-dideoxy-D-galactose acyltransferase [Vibrio splendidus]TVU61441.1 dTDP-4-amino-4,6-dideoxy-D-galactose acyltransferase [Vibrio atlanticus]
MKTNISNVYHFSLREWDSQFFSKKIGDVQWGIEKTQLASANSYDLITTRVGSLEHTKIEVLQNHGFVYCDGDVQLTKDIHSNDSEIDFQMATQEQLPKLLTMLDNMYQISRFKAPWFATQDRDRFYKEWLTKAVYGTFDDCCLMIAEEDKICGFVTLKEFSDYAQIGLIGVGSEYQGKGIGKKLLSVAEQYLKQRNCTTLNVATQTSNTHALNLYTRFGFRLTETNLWFYKSDQ